VSLASEIAHGPSDIIIIVESSDDMSETTIFLDTYEMMDLAIGASHRSDGASHT